MSFNILGTGSSVPKMRLTNHDITSFLDTSDEWIYSRTGIKERHIMKEESSLSMTVEASKRALEDANLEGRDLDLIICASLSQEDLSPSLACMIQKEIGANCPAFDINAACTGFIYALDIAGAYIKVGKYKKILVVAFEALSKLVNWDDRSTSVLFGDGCGAVVLGEGDGFLYSSLHAQGEWESLNISDLGEGRPVVHMNGKEIFRFALNSGITQIPKALEETGIKEEDVDHVILHQANKRIIDSIAEKLKIPKDRYAINIENFGNTSAASIPLTLDGMNREGKLKKGDILVMTAFGGGLTSGTCVIKWKKGK